MYFTNNGIDLYQGDMQVGDREATQDEIKVHLSEFVKRQTNIRVLAQIEELEKQAHRPLRELQLDNTNTFAKTKLTEIDEKITELRKELIL